MYAGRQQRLSTSNPALANAHMATPTMPLAKEEEAAVGGGAASEEKAAEDGTTDSDSDSDEDEVPAPKVGRCRLTLG